MTLNQSPTYSDISVEDVEYVYTRQMNAKVLGVDPLDVSTQGSSMNAINKVKSALKDIAEHRTEIGSSQNILEQSGISMMAQANQTPQGVLSLLS